MANGTATGDEIDQEQEQVQEPLPPGAPINVFPSGVPRTRTDPITVVPPVVAPRQTIVAPPGAAPITNPNYPQWSMGERVANVQAMGNAQTMDQAEKAVAAAQRFQAQRGYQRDIAGGMSAVDAMVKWGPLMFGSTAGSANALARVAVAAQPESERVMGAGGQIYRVPKTGNAIRITPDTPTKIAPALATAYAREIAHNEQKIDAAKDPFGADTDALRSRNYYLRQQLQGSSIPAASPRPVVAPPSAPVAASTAAPTVTTKAQFDALASGAIYIGKNGKRYRKP